jgi:hypothetical protein
MFLTEAYTTEPSNVQYASARGESKRGVVIDETSERERSVPSVIGTGFSGICAQMSRANFLMVAEAARDDELDFEGAILTSQQPQTCPS